MLHKNYPDELTKDEFPINIFFHSMKYKNIKKDMAIYKKIN